MGAPSEFHDDAHPEATDITGDRQYGEWGQCVADASSTGERCRGYALGPHGKCRNHGGKAGAPEGNQNAVGNDGGAPEENQNAITHGYYANNHNFYQHILDDAGRAFVDDVLADYLTRFEASNGREPTLGEEAQLFDVAIGHAKTLHAENWATDRPDDLDSGNALVDREVHVSESGERYYRYKETVVQAPIRKLSKERRATLKDFGLLDDPESQKADALGDLSDGATLVFGDEGGADGEAAESETSPDTSAEQEATSG